MPLQVIQLTALPSKLQQALGDGVSRAECPRCGGGSSRELSLSAQYREDGIISLWCYRSTCGFKALTLDDPEANFIRKQVKGPKFYDKPTIPVQGEPKSRLMVDYGLLPEVWEEHGWRLSEHGRELVMPILDPNGLQRGTITRTLYETPKRVYTYKATALPFLDYWVAPESTAPVVVVEDTLSACRLSGLGYNSVALLGTGLSRDDVKEIARTAAERPVILALDRDAFGKAVQYASRHRHLLKFAAVLCLPQDIKNIDDDDKIRELLDYGRHNARSGSVQRAGSL